MFRPRQLGDYGTAAVLQTVNKSEDPKARKKDFAMNYRFKKSRNNDGVDSKKTTLESI